MARQRDYRHSSILHCIARLRRKPYSLQIRELAELCYERLPNDIQILIDKSLCLEELTLHLSDFLPELSIHSREAGVFVDLIDRFSECSGQHFACVDGSLCAILGEYDLDEDQPWLIKVSPIRELIFQTGKDCYELTRDVSRLSGNLGSFGGLDHRGLRVYSQILGLRAAHSRP